MKLNPHSYTQADGIRLFRMPPEAAIKYFGGKEIITNWQSIMGDAHSRAFTVAGETREEVLQDLYSALQDALASGSTMDTFRNDAMQRLQKNGWLRGVVKYEDNNEPVYENTANTTYDRLERIYRTNLSSAHAAGRFESIMQSELEFVEYVTAEDDRVREEHRLAAGVYHKDDPFLLYFSPPNGYNCRCTLQARSEAWVIRQGLDPDAIRAKAGVNRVKERDIIEEGSVRTYHVYDFGGGKVFEADKGWDYNPALKFWEARSVRHAVSTESHGYLDDNDQAQAQKELNTILEKAITALNKEYADYTEGLKSVLEGLSDYGQGVKHMDLQQKIIEIIKKERSINNLVLDTFYDSDYGIATDIIDKMKEKYGLIK